LDAPSGTPAVPIGVQVLAPARGEPVMFRVARAIEAAAPGGGVE
jgi:Asp-tRNA(Asn)/Glu-tRNA(Gln) amidotransferase A subunit family amidase